MTCLIGIAVGLVDSVMTYLIQLSHVFKMWLLEQALVADVSSAVVAFCAMLLYSLPIVIAACLLVLTIAPMAMGSSLAEVKALLNGAHVPGLLSFRTGWIE